MIRLRELRLEKGIKSQREFASLIDIPSSTYNYWENERMQMDYDTLIKLAEYFNVSVDYLLGRDYVPSEIEQKNKAPQNEELTALEIKLLDVFKKCDIASQGEIIGFAKKCLEDIYEYEKEVKNI